MTTTNRTERHFRIGDLLVDNGYLDREQLDIALAEQKQCGEKLGTVLARRGWIEKSELMEFLSHQLQLPIIDLHRQDIRPSECRRLPIDFSRQHQVVVLEEQTRHFVLGMADPTDLEAREAAARVLGKPVQVALVRDGELTALLDLLERHFEEVDFLDGSASTPRG